MVSDQHHVNDHAQSPHVGRWIQIYVVVIECIRRAVGSRRSLLRA
jgi:hypothetical protein